MGRDYVPNGAYGPYEGMVWSLACRLGRFAACLPLADAHPPAAKFISDELAGLMTLASPSPPKNPTRCQLREANVVSSWTAYIPYFYLST